jgi:sugar lactone lactonase YvrE
MAVNATILADHLDLPESPRWHDGEIGFVDGGGIRIIGRDGKPRIHASIDTPVLLGLSFTAQGDVLVSDSVRRRVYSVSGAGDVELYADLSAHTQHMLNEPMMMADGSVVVGDIGFDVLQGAAPQSAHMIRISDEGKIDRTGAPMWFSNGLVSIDRGSGLLAAETVTGKIRRYRLRADGLDDGAVVASVDIRGLDGIALSPDGSLWCADIDRGVLVQLDSGGRELRRIASGFPHATSCVTDDTGAHLIVTVLRAGPTSGLRCDGALISIPLGSPDAPKEHGP